LGILLVAYRNNNDWLVHDASLFIVNNLTRVHLLFHQDTQDIVAYIALCDDSFTIEKEAKEKHKFPIATLPALKIGKLAIDHRYERKKIGSYMIWLAVGIADYFLESIDCRFITVDADVEYDPNTPVL
jgi:hypothetical protein